MRSHLNVGSLLCPDRLGDRQVRGKVSFPTIHKEPENEERSIVQSVIARQGNKWDFDLGTCITNMQRHHMSNKDAEETNESNGDEEKDRDLNTFVSVKEGGLSIKRVFTKEKHPQGPQDYMVQGNTSQDRFTRTKAYQFINCCKKGEKWYEKRTTNQRSKERIS